MTTRQREWFRFQNSAATKSADIYIFDAIGRFYADDPEDDITAAGFNKDLQALATDVRALRVHVSSPGGDVFEANAIGTSLLEWGAAKPGRTVTTIVTGLAASAATLVVVAGGTIEIASDALMMVHKPWMMLEGNARQLRGAADVLDKVEDSMITAYKRKSKLTRDELANLLAATTWMSADEAVLNGFATKVIHAAPQSSASSVPAAAVAFRPAAFERLGTIPERYRATLQRWQAPAAAAGPGRPDGPAARGSRSATAAAALDVIRACSEAGVTVAIAEALIAEGAPMAEVKTRVAAERTRADAEALRVKALGWLCGPASGLPPKFANDIRDRLVRSGTSFEVAKALILTTRAMLDEQLDIDSTIMEGYGGSQRRIDIAAVYEGINSGRKM